MSADVPAAGAPLRVLAVADTDSYVKWGAALLDRGGPGWDRDLLVLASTLRPSAAQLAAALAGTRFAGEPSEAARRVIDLAAIARRVREWRPDVVLVTVRGPVVKVVLRVVVAASGGSRPVLVTGLPGISIPATRKAVAYRAQADLIVVHSRHEVAAFGRLSERMGMPQRFGLARLPFLPPRVAVGAVAEGGATPAMSASTEPAGAGSASWADSAVSDGSHDGAATSASARGGDPHGDIVFAAQAKVPEERSERIELLGWLAEAARRTPWRRVVIKVRGSRGEPQTHPERFDYADLIGELSPPAPPNLVIEGGPMATHLAGAAGLVTISSTAAIEAVAVGVPVLALTDFGVRPGLINTVFEGSGLLGDSCDLVMSRFRMPDPAWLDANYFHPAEADDWTLAVEELAAARARAPLPLTPQPNGTLGGRLRFAWDRKRALGAEDRSVVGAIALMIGWPVMKAQRMLKRARRAYRVAFPPPVRPAALASAPTPVDGSA